MLEKHVLEEARNIARNSPLFPGNTVDHETARECIKRGWAEKNSEGDLIPTANCPFSVIQGCAYRS